MPLIQEAIRVMIRIKPTSCPSIYQDTLQPNVLHCGEKCYTLDHIFTAESTDQEVFERVGLGMVDNALKGYNNTLFVYGQTGTGKTYTMSGSNKEEGLIQKCVNLIRTKLENESQYENYTIKMSYLEIYNQTVKDLLAESERVVREITKSGFYVQGLTQVSIENQNEFFRYFKKGMLARQTKATQINQMSSRSHSILTVLLETRQCINGASLVKTSKLNFVDLAGSEKLRQTGAIGNRKTEASHINQSLGTLRKVISTLQRKKSKNLIHIPYRESVLTKILKDSLGGNSHTIIIGTINANAEYISETISTLNFLEGARHVKNQTKINQKIQGSEDKLKQALQSNEETIVKLEQQLSSAKSELEQVKKNERRCLDQIAELKNRILSYQSPIQEWYSIDSSTALQKGFFLQQNENALSFNGDINNLQEITQLEDDQTSQQFSHRSLRVREQVRSQNVCSSDNICKNSKKSILSTDKEDNALLKLKVKYLEQRLKKHYEDDNKYDSLLKLVHQNIKKLQFTEAQLNIIQLHQEQLSRTQEHLKIAEEYSRKISKTLKRDIVSLKSKDFDNISKHSSWTMKEKSLNKELQISRLKIEEMETQLTIAKEINKTEMLKLREVLAEERRERERLEYSEMLLMNENTNLKQTVDFQQRRHLTAKLQLEMKVQTDKDIFLRQFSSERQKESQAFYQKIQDKLNTFVTDIEELQKDKEDLLLENSNLLQENSNLQQKIKQKDSQLELLRFDLKQSQSVLQYARDQLYSLEQCFRSDEEQFKGIIEKYLIYYTVEVEGEKITLDRLQQKYESVTKAYVKLKQESRTYEAKIKTLSNKVHCLQLIIDGATEQIKNRVAGKDMQILKLQNQNKQLKAELYLYHDSQNSTQLSLMEQEYKRTIKQYENKMKETIYNIQEYKATWNDLYSRKQEQIQKLNMKLKIQREELERMKEENKLLKAQRRSDRSILEKINKEAIQKYEMEADKCREFKRQLQDNQRELSLRQNELKELKTYIFQNEPNHHSRTNKSREQNNSLKRFGKMN